MGSTITLHSLLKAPPERIWRAFTEPAAMARWLPPNGYTCTVHHMDAKVGGTFRMSFSCFANGQTHAFGGEFIEMVPYERLRYTDRFEDPSLPGTLTVTVLLRPVMCGTDLCITQENVPDVIPPELCYLGWQDSLRHLAALVEPEPTKQA
jgi:uncharacterized protein YndB with AHSA1/START domain